MKIFFCAFVLFAVPILQSADSNAEVQLITLKDNSVIRAKVIGDDGKFFIIKSSVLGEKKIRTTEILSIRQTNQQIPILPPNLSLPVAGSGSAGSSQETGSPDTLAGKVHQFLSSGSGAANQLSQNPDMKAVLADPNLVKAIQSGDAASLRESPAVKQLLSDPQTKSIIKSLLNMNGSPQ